jgi:hypothetical protein
VRARNPLPPVFRESTRARRGDIVPFIKSDMPVQAKGSIVEIVVRHLGSFPGSRTGDFRIRLGSRDQGLQYVQRPCPAGRSAGPAICVAPTLATISLILRGKLAPSRGDTDAARANRGLNPGSVCALAAVPCLRRRNSGYGKREIVAPTTLWLRPMSASVSPSRSPRLIASRCWWGGRPIFCPRAMAPRPAFTHSG